MTVSRRSVLKSGVALGATAAIPWGGAATAQDGKTLKIAIWSKFTDLYRKVADQFEAANPGVTVEIDTSAHDKYHDRLLTRFASGDKPDLAMIVDFHFHRFQSRGFLENLNDYVDASDMFDRSKPGFGHFYPGPTNFFTVNDAVSAIPLEVNPFVIAYNIDMFKSAGIPTPNEQWEQGNWNWDNFVETAKAMTVGAGNQKIYGYAEGKVKIWALACRVWANGGRYFNEDRTKILLDQPEAYEAIQDVLDLHLVHGVTPTNMRAADGNPSNWFPQGRAAMSFTGTWSKAQNKDADFEWGVANLPRRVREASWAGGYSFAVPKGATNSDLAWKFIEFSTTVDMSKFLLENGSPGSAVPAAMNSSSFLKEPPKNSEAFLRMLAVAEPQPFIPRTSEFLAIHDREMDLAAIGRKTAKEATKIIAEEAQHLLQG